MMRQEEEKLIVSRTNQAMAEEWHEDPEITNLKYKNTSLFWDCSKKGMDLKKQIDQVQEYQAAFNVLSENSGITDYNEIVNTMSQFEDANFSSVQRISSI